MIDLQVIGADAIARTLADAMRTHPMRMNLSERSFLRSALADLETSGAIQAEIGSSIGRALS